MPLPKYVGRDCELSTTGIGPGGAGIQPWEVARAVLGSIGAAYEPLGLRVWSEAVARWHLEGGSPAVASRGSAWSPDCLRHWLPNGACCYSDMAHVELASGESLDPCHFAGQSLALLRVAEAARLAAEGEAPEGTRYALSTSNADALDPAISFGTHVNVSIRTQLWEDLFLDQDRPAVLGFVASVMAAAIPFFGAGYLLPLRSGTVYSLSGRAHHISRVKSDTTTEAFRRGLLNSRREPHAVDQERLHLIGFDFSLGSAALKCSLLQCALAAAEEGFCQLVLYDPVRAVRTWSWNLDLGTGRLPATAELIDGRRLTLPEYMGELAARLLGLCESKAIGPEVAPRAPDLLSRIRELAERSGRGEIEAVARHLDWAAKLLTLVDVCRERGVELGDPVTRLVDHDFATTSEDSPFWRLRAAGLVDPLVDQRTVEALLRDGPPESRAWGRGRIVRRFREALTDVDWGRVELRRDGSRWGTRLRLEMARPDSLRRSTFRNVIERAVSVDDLEEWLRRTESHRPGARVAEADPLLDIASQLAPAGPT